MTLQLTPTSQRQAPPPAANATQTVSTATGVKSAARSPLARRQAKWSRPIAHSPRAAPAGPGPTNHTAGIVHAILFKVQGVVRRPIADDWPSLITPPKHGKSISKMPRAKLTRLVLGSGSNSPCGIPSPAQGASITEQVGGGVDAWDRQSAIGRLRGHRPVQLPGDVPIVMFHSPSPAGNSPFIMKAVGNKDPRHAAAAWPNCLTEGTGLPDGVFNVGQR